VAFGSGWHKIAAAVSSNTDTSFDPRIHAESQPARHGAATACVAIPTSQGSTKISFLVLLRTDDACHTRDKRIKRTLARLEALTIQNANIYSKHPVESDLASHAADKMQNIQQQGFPRGHPP
jgi:hypothetical protein